MTGSINGVITPDLDMAAPHMQVLLFMLGHGGLVIGCAFAVFGLQL